MITYRSATQLFGIATAYHVIQHAYEWGEPIRLTHAQSGVTRLFYRYELVILTKPERDVAIVLFSDSTLQLPTIPLTLAPSAKFIKPAMRIGWLGYPVSITTELCFFQGSISSFLHEVGSYLVDGVAINGVSGGPAFIVFPFPGRDLTIDQISLVGLVSNYFPNRATGEALPGVCGVRGIYPYHDIIAEIQSSEDARAKEQELTSQQTSESAGTLPSLSGEARATSKNTATLTTIPSEEQEAQEE